MDVKVRPRENGASIVVNNNYEIMVTVKPVRGPPTLAEIQEELKEYTDDLSISEKEEGIVVKPEGYLGRGKFASIAEKMRELGGTYISAGKNSRFVISKKKGS
ncbi:MAG: hypothetical protein ACOC6H_05015 [Thermoproteota archaeon]